MPAGQQVRRHRGRQAAFQAQAGDVVDAVDRAQRHLRDGTQQVPRSLDRASHAGTEECGGFVADRHLARLGHSFHHGGLGGRRSGDNELPVPAARQEEHDLAAMYADGHPQPCRARSAGNPAGPPERPSHLPRGGACRSRMPVALEEQQHRVATPLDQIRAVFAGDIQQAGEYGVEDLAHLFGPHLARPRESLGQPGEPGDVDEPQRAVHRAVTGPRATSQPVDHDCGHVRPEGLVLVGICHPLPLSGRRVDDAMAGPGPSRQTRLCDHCVPGNIPPSSTEQTN